jgi:hypothetical protein
MAAAKASAVLLNSGWPSKKKIGVKASKKATPASEKNTKYMLYGLRRRTGKRSKHQHQHAWSANPCRGHVT